MSDALGPIVREEAGAIVGLLELADRKVMCVTMVSERGGEIGRLARSCSAASTRRDAGLFLQLLERECDRLREILAKAPS